MRLPHASHLAPLRKVLAAFTFRFSSTVKLLYTEDGKYL
jgi:hypothetical protein